MLVKEKDMMMDELLLRTGMVHRWSLACAIAAASLTIRQSVALPEGF
ncbi:hypothetical protein [Massilia agri]|uniref:Uncharacterized protein n=1 Tax=Massilia agri TaxID=1886785 RepID=A0ABT2AGH3_9BURK|nr:hypothetical protein [Massilia agri]MCS0595339.1 hypothetical protein [Massilia agri]